MPYKSLGTSIAMASPAPVGNPRAKPLFKENQKVGWIPTNFMYF